MNNGLWQDSTVLELAKMWLLDSNRVGIWKY